MPKKNLQYLFFFGWVLFFTLGYTVCVKLGGFAGAAVDCGPHVDLVLDVRSSLHSGGAPFLHPETY